MRTILSIFIGVAIAIGVSAVGLIWWAYGKNGALRSSCPIQSGDRITSASGKLEVGARIKVGDGLYRVLALDDERRLLTHREWRWFDWLIPCRLYQWWKSL